MGVTDNTRAVAINRGKGRRARMPWGGLAIGRGWTPWDQALAGQSGKGKPVMSQARWAGLGRARRPQLLARDELPRPGVAQAAGLHDLDAGRVGARHVALAVDEEAFLVVVLHLVVAVEDR